MGFKRARNGAIRSCCTFSEIDVRDFFFDFFSVFSETKGNGLALPDTNFIFFAELLFYVILRLC